MAKVIQIPLFKKLEKDELGDIIENEFSASISKAIVQPLETCFFVVIDTETIDEQEINSLWLSLLKKLTEEYGEPIEYPKHSTKTLLNSKGQIKKRAPKHLSLIHI